MLGHRLKPSCGVAAAPTLQEQLWHWCKLLRKRDVPTLPGGGQKRGADKARPDAPFHPPTSRRLVQSACCACVRAGTREEAAEAVCFVGKTGEQQAVRRKKGCGKSRERERERERERLKEWGHIKRKRTQARLYPACLSHSHRPHRKLPTPAHPALALTHSLPPSLARSLAPPLTSTHRRFFFHFLAQSRRLH